MRLLLTVVSGGADRDIAMDVETDTPVGALVEQDRPPGDWYLDGVRLDPTWTVSRAGLVAGVRLGAGAPVPDGGVRYLPGDPRTHWLEVHGVGGPSAGRIWPVGLGCHDIGSAPGSAIDPGGCGVPAHAARLTIDEQGRAWVATVGAEVRLAMPQPPAQTDPVSTPGYPGHPEQRVSDLRAAQGREHPDEPDASGPRRDGSRRWPTGVDLAVGDSLLRLAPRPTPDAAVTPAVDVPMLDFNRPPRIVPPLLFARRRLPSPPVKPNSRPIPLLMILAPMVMGLAFVFLFRSYFFLLIMALSPVLALANWYTDRRSGRKRYRRDLAEYLRKRTRMMRELTAAVAEERLARCEASPDPATVLHTAVGPGRRLWERRRRDPDHLVLRVGTLDQPSLIEVEDPARPDTDRQLRWIVPDTPVTVDLVDRKVIGLAGAAETTYATARWLVLQAAALHSPRDLRIHVLTEQAGEERWSWVRWLPHTRPAEDGVLTGRPYTLVGNDPETVANRMAELVSLVTARTKARGSQLGQVLFSEPDVLLVVDGARRLRDVPGMVQVLTEGPTVQVFAICIDAEERLLPEECTAVLRADADGLTVRQTGVPEAAGVRPDIITARWCERVARALAPLRDVTPDETAGLPDRSRLLDLLDADPPDGADLAERWSRQPASTSFVIGSGFDGTVALDLVRDGPHALVAGTTGAGKSELLQSMVVSLAAVNRPDELTFVLVDYKGGSAFHSCVRLPHTLGMVTDLDSALVVRALESLGAELRRREEILAGVAAKDLVQYRTMRGRDPSLPAVPRLVLVIDEFATLAREVPDFVPGLVSIAQRGRSLGIHLILATQRPGGVVTGDIRANTNLRIALRVTDPTESSDVIDVPDAAMIPVATPGRALARLAHRSTLPFQTGYVGAVYQRADSDAPQSRPAAPVPGTELPWSRLGRALPPPVGTTRDGATPDELAATDLDVLVDAIDAAARAVGCERQSSPWLPPLPPVVLLDDLTPPGPRTGPGLPPVPYALADLPERQSQATLACDLSTFGHLYVLGASRSGRSQLMRTLAASLARSLSCAEVHLYAIDAAGGSMVVLSELPHCGAVVPRADLERLERLLGRLQDELARRHELLARHSCAGLDELRAALPAAERPAHLMLLVDGWDSLAAVLTDHDGGRLLDQFLGLLREGPAAGLHLVMSSERSLLTGRVANLNDHRIMLRMTDRTDYSVIGVNHRRVPDVVPPGRGWRSTDQAEIQVALLDRDPSGPAQVEAIRRIGARAAARDSGVPAGRRPFPVAGLPAAVTFAEAYAQVPEEQRHPMRALLGIGGNAATPVYVDFAGRQATFLVAGPPGSGRSNTLATLAVSLLAGGTALVILTPRESVLRRLAAHARVRTVEGATPDPARVSAAVEELGGPSVVLVDDVDLFGFANPVEAVLRQVVGTGRDRALGLAYAGTAETLTQSLGGWIAEARRSRQGVLLAPQSAIEGDLVGARVPPGALRSGSRPGRGYVPDPATGALSMVTIPHTVLR
ncbi:FtsK/SpoIIIE domain-containing protein [Solwaraspora sp. WMMD1047]|uniref:FtsK/SpoIIIE domain-containing protein n=1 Tax=Solwaraspora sp. WMMD1047 TaxID=3016102 RepID=UPI002416C56F|nr:FtsK/SpoIIIE domain-containing protein [Solwaraspora sp. WMMD1047]MDG4833908.1 FtsK/SpoIIIE domain-containing protein [Solwaraspora sp. WMMD1047]